MKEKNKIILIKYWQLVFIILAALPVELNGQIADTIPVLSHVTINQITGEVEISWTKSSSKYVVGYIIYNYHYDPGFPGGGYAADPIDTIWGLSSTYYSANRPFTSFQSESYVVMAINDVFNKTPWHNPLNTIFIKPEFDACNSKITINWNSYPSYPDSVINYSVFQSVNEGPFLEIAKVNNDIKTCIIEDFDFNSGNCYLVKANLESGKHSVSNTSCIQTIMQRPPKWINADYATTGDDNKIKLSFTIDPLSEISSFRLERKTIAKGDFQTVKQFTSVKESLSYTDNESDSKIIHFYRLAAVNSCGIPVVYSNIASNIVLSASFSGNKIDLTWNSYRKWTGITGSYILFIRTGEEFIESSGIVPPDTVFSINYKDIMYDVTGKEICLMIKAFERSNPYGISGVSASSAVCLPVLENITVPNLFIPEGNNIKEINRYFQPVLSFTPSEYHLVITDLRRRTVFETRNFLEKWDGRLNGALLPEGVYLWLLRIKTPSGNTVAKTGTVTLKINKP